MVDTTHLRTSHPNLRKISCKLELLHENSLGAAHMVNYPPQSFFIDLLIYESQSKTLKFMLGLHMQMALRQKSGQTSGTLEVNFPSPPWHL